MKKILISLFLFTIVFTQDMISSDNSREITIYKDGFATLKEPIVWNLKAGKNTTRFDNLSPNIVFDSPNLDLQGVQILSQTMNRNFNSSDSFLKNNIGSQVEIRLSNGAVNQGKLLDINGSSIAINTNKGLMVFQRTKIDFINLKANNIQDKFSPEISWDIFSSQDQTVFAELTYLTSGFSWKPIYKLELNTNDSSAILNVDAEVINHSNINLLGININVVEGELNQVNTNRPSSMQMQARRLADDSVNNKLGDFYIFKLGNNLNLKSLESVQFPLIPKRSISYEKIYVFSNVERDQKDEPLDIEISFDNSEENNLNLPLPSGIAYLYERSVDNKLNFLAKNNISQLYKGGSASFSAGKAFDIVGKRRILNYDRQSNVEESTISLQVINSSEKPIKVKVIEKIIGDWVVKQSSSMYIKDDASTIYFPLEIGPNSSQSVTYTYKKEWK
ncbi:MAG: hypothetical protein VYE63_01385 [Candidatus Neomarinimicrobiota bacterium]|nr:hypothetical protein [Candidatus Neomarinimicrobiota bacterium]